MADGTLVRDRPPARCALPRARPVRAQRREPGAARVASAAQLAVALPLRRRARRPCVRRARRPGAPRAASDDARAAAVRLLRGRARTVSSTLFRKVWDAHVVDDDLLYIDLHL